MVNTRLYHIHHSIKQRCYCVTHANYKYYGGRGIKMCDEWKEILFGRLNK